eukprot:GHVS01085752.1.p1 GENE.GHVS01085752.1~~GHVS01085752.1.p1  ORF type:complete len:258 (+),score=88.66 GHVS01085752.1:219-992(+)
MILYVPPSPFYSPKASSSSLPKSSWHCPPPVFGRSSVLLPTPVPFLSSLCYPPLLHKFPSFAFTLAAPVFVTKPTGTATATSPTDKMVSQQSTTTSSSTSSSSSSSTAACPHRTYTRTNLRVLFVCLLSLFLFAEAAKASVQQPSTAHDAAALEGVRVVENGRHPQAARSKADDGASGGSSVGHATTPEEFEDYKRDFEEFDLNRDGLIDAHELRAAFQQDKVEPEELYQFFMDVDTDSSGTVTEMEYLEYALNFHS